jgi:RimJ/RimL family protein N-acetyltransferase
MASVSVFERADTEDVAALWRSLHPDWMWLDDRERLPLVFERQDAIEQIRYVVRCRKTVIGTVFARCAAEPNGPLTLFIDIQTRHENIAAEWVDPILASLADRDRGRPDMWHVTSVATALSPAAAPLLEAAGFARHSRWLIMEWNSEPIALIDPGTAHLQRYAGGYREIDRAIADLHNRAYSSSRMVGPAEGESLWDPWPGQEAREFVLAWEGNRLIGFAQWCVNGGEAFISNLAVARSHWGTAISSAIGTRAMQLLFELGHRRVESIVHSNNAASMGLQRKLGWKVAREQAHTFVRRL